MAPKSVKIREVGPREGFQTLSKVVSTDKKIKLISALNETGVKDIEVTSFVRADLMPQMADSEEVAKSFPAKEGIRYTALYLNIKGFVKGEEFSKINNGGWLNIATSETFLRKNNNSSVEKILSEIPSWLTAFNAHKKSLEGLMLSTAFGCGYEGKIKPEKTVSLLGKVIEVLTKEGATLLEVCLADTVGMGVPDDIRKTVEMIRFRYPDLKISLHLHDTRGTGMANVYAGLLEEVDCFDASVGGLGGCPFAKGASGNVPSEDVAYLCEEMGISTGLNLDAYVKAAKLAEKIIGAPLPGKLKNAV